MHRFLVLAAIACFVWPSACSQTAQAQTTPTPRELLDATAAVYAAARTYQDTGSVVTVLVQNEGEPKVVEKSFKTAFVRPDRFRLEFTDAESASKYIVWRNGSDVRTWRPSRGEDYPESLGVGMASIAGASGGAVHAAATLLMPDEVQGRMLTDLTDVEQLAAIEVPSGHACFRLRGKLWGHPMLLYIDQSTRLVRQIDLEMELAGCRIEQTTTYEPVIDEEVSDALLEFATPDAEARARDAPNAAGQDTLRATKQVARVVLVRDPATGKTVRTVDFTAVTDDEDLERQLTLLRDAAAASGRRLSVTIDSVRDVPWNDVVTVVNACEKLGIKGLEFEIRDP